MTLVKIIAQILVPIFLIILVSTVSASENDTFTEVLLVIKNDEIIAFSALKSNWVSIKLRQYEAVISSQSKGNVAVVFTSDHILGFSVFTNFWNTESLRLKEKLVEIQVDGNVETVVTNQRIFGFSAHSGRWIEAD